MPEYTIELENDLALHIVGPQNAIDRVEQLVKENERLRAALRPFADALKGNWSHQPDYMTITAGPHGRDLRLELLLGHFREARTALKENGDE